MTKKDRFEVNLSFFMMQNHARRLDILGKYTYICTVKAMNSNE